MWTLTRLKTPLCLWVRRHMDGNTFSSVTPINCCWHCPLEMCDSALALQTLCSESLLSAPPAVRGQRYDRGYPYAWSLWVWIYILAPDTFSYYSHLLLGAARSIAIFQLRVVALNHKGLIVSVYETTNLCLLGNSFPGVPVLVTVLLVRCRTDQYTYVVLIYWVGFAENGKPMAVFNGLLFQGCSCRVCVCPLE